MKRLRRRFVAGPIARRHRPNHEMVAAAAAVMMVVVGPHPPLLAPVGDVRPIGQLPVKGMWVVCRFCGARPPSRWFARSGCGGRCTRGKEKVPRLPCAIDRAWLRYRPASLLSEGGGERGCLTLGRRRVACAPAGAYPIRFPPPLLSLEVDHNMYCLSICM